MTAQQALQFGIAVNLVAGVGAVGFGRLDDRIGSRTTMVLSLAGLAVAGCAILLVRSQPAFWAFGPLLGVFVTPGQAASGPE